MKAAVSSVPNRTFAHPLDKPFKGLDQQTHGVGRSSDAIGGYYGIGWYEFFRDRETGEVYRVHCSDGVYGGKCSYSDEDENWRYRCYRSTMERTQQEAAHGIAEVHLSTNEWILMQGFTHALWLDPQEGEEYAQQADCSIEEGLIGHIKSVPVIVDPNKKDELPPR